MQFGDTAECNSALQGSVVHPTASSVMRPRRETHSAKCGRLYLLFISRVTRFIPNAPRPRATRRSPLQDASCISSLAMTRPARSHPGRIALHRSLTALTLTDGPACQTLRPAIAAAGLRWIGRRKPSCRDAKSSHEPGRFLSRGACGQRRAWAWTRAAKSRRAS
jgi:hypothetical protein